MMNFSKRSLAELATVHHDLRALFTAVNEHRPCTILQGHRNEADQNAAFASGKSKLRWPNGKHNSLPSLAVDAAPDPVDWSNWQAFYEFAGYVLATADAMGLNIRWGGNWNGGPVPRGQPFTDLPHFELTQDPDFKITSPLAPVNARG